MDGIVDIHCHIIYDVDDGAKTIVESKKMLALAYAEGVRTIIATPHFWRGAFECPAQMIKERYQEIKHLAKSVGDGMEILLGCECYANSELVHDLKASKCLTMAGSKHILVEFSEETEFAYIREQIYELICNGYQPIIAHVERYHRIEESHIEELVAMGATMQVNAGSIIGEDGFKIKRRCKQMMKKDLLSFVGSDAHGSATRPPKLRRCADYIEKKMGKEYAYKILIENPKSIIQAGVN